MLADNGSWQAVQAGWKTSERAAHRDDAHPVREQLRRVSTVSAYGSVPKYLVAAHAFLKARRLDDPDHRGHQRAVLRRHQHAERSLSASVSCALANPVIASVVAKPTADEPNVGAISNTNKLLGSHGVNGIKTGTYDTVKANLLFSAKVTVGTRTVQLVGVILGARPMTPSTLGCPRCSRA